MGANLIDLPPKRSWLDRRELESATEDIEDGALLTPVSVAGSVAVGVEASAGLLVVSSLGGGPGVSDMIKDTFLLPNIGRAGLLAPSDMGGNLLMDSKCGSCVSEGGAHRAVVAISRHV